MGDEVQRRVVAAKDFERVVFKLGKLSGASHRLCTHQIRRSEFVIAALEVVVEHERRQSPREARTVAGENGKPGPRELRRAFEIDEADGLRQGHMVFDGVGKRARRPNRLQNDICRFIRAHRHVFARMVWNPEQQLVEGLFEGFDLRLRLFDRDRKRLHRIALGLDLFFGRFFHARVEVVALGLMLLQRGNFLPPFARQRDDTVESGNLAPTG